MPDLVSDRIQKAVLTTMEVLRSLCASVLELIGILTAVFTTSTVEVYQKESRKQSSPQWRPCETCIQGCTTVEVLRSLCGPV